MCWRKSRESHPLSRNPASGGGLDGPIIGLGKHIPLRTGAQVALPFDIALPVDARPPQVRCTHR